jgi:hypothetical protein
MFYHVLVRGTTLTYPSLSCLFCRMVSSSALSIKDIVRSTTNGQCDGLGKFCQGHLHLTRKTVKRLVVLWENCCRLESIDIVSNTERTLLIVYTVLLVC